MGSFVMPAVLIVLGIAQVIVGISTNGFAPIIIGTGFIVFGIISAKNAFRKRREIRGRTGKSSPKLLDRIRSGKISDPEKLKNIVLGTKNYTMEERSAALDKLTDPQALQEVVHSRCGLEAEALRKISDPEYLKKVVRTNEGGLALAAVRRIDDQAFLAEIVGGSFPGISSAMQVEALRGLRDPETLAGLGNRISRRKDQELSRVWLEHMYKAAVDNPELMLRVSGTARSIISNAHADGQMQVGGRHTDSWQRVPHMSSDCHEDHTPWTSAKSAWGEWGYHGDGTTGSTLQHQDSNPFDTWEERFS